MARFRTTSRSRSAAVVLLLGAAVARSGDRAPERHEVDIRALSFQPARLSVAPGDTVVWTHRDLVPHTVTDADGRWDSGELGGGETYTLVVPPGADSIPYVCAYHPGMRGTLTVR